MSNRIVKIPKSRLPIEADTGAYILRYRIISEDRNRFSAWTPSYRIIAPTISEILQANNLASLDTPVYSHASGVATVAWNAPAFFDPLASYDLYVRWGKASTPGTYDNEYSFVKSVSASSFTLARPENRITYDRVDLHVQSVTYPKKILNSQKIYSIEAQPI